MYLSAQELARVRKHWPDYVWAVGKVGFPVRWAFALAGIHYCESGLREDAPGEPGGPFCLDPDGEGDQLARIRGYAESVCAKWGHVAMDLSLEKDFRTAALVAANELRGKASRPIGDTWDEMGLALAKYNGFPRRYCEAWQTGAGSIEPAVRWHPYVSNDPQRGIQLYAQGFMLDARGETVEVPRHAALSPGTLVIAREIQTRWRDWFVSGDERAPHPESLA